MEKALIYAPELWEELNIYPITQGKYKISNAGRVFNNYTQRLVPQHQNKLNGYMYVTLSIIDGRSKLEFCVHRLVAITFIPNPENKQQVNHLDQKWINDDLHLEWVTPKENSQHAVSTGLTPIGEDRYNAVFTNEQVRQICKLLELGYNRYGEILDLLQLENNEGTRELVGRIKRGETWKQISSQYKIPTESYGNPIIFTEEQIHQICNYISKGYRNIDILRLMTGDLNASTYSHKPEYDVIYKIKGKKNYTHISNQYF